MSAPVIIPRWEWRTFGQGFGAAEEKIKQHANEGTKTSREKYILSKVSSENVKIRFDLIDVKSLKEINADKLEQWFPAMKAGFPVGKDALARLFDEFFKTPAPVFARDEYTFEQFLDEVIIPNDTLCVVDVEKERHAYKINGTTVEIAETKFNGVPMRTICVEHTDPALVISTVCELGAEGFENINYINAMKTAVGMEKVQ
jgi:exopolyphosphatase/guanosine-5'-triphosphate,3'-diphosphate pyrophosphatase